MKKLILALILMVMFTGLSYANGDDDVSGCENHIGGKVKLLATTVVQQTTNDLVGSGATFDPTPLFSTVVKTSNKSCIIATLSALARPHDNWVMFQVLVDGVVMNGHIGADDFFTRQGYPLSADLVNPDTQILADPEAGDQNLFRMLSYTVFLPVENGDHTVEVRWTGCCTTLPENLNTSEIGRATLLLNYR